MFIPAIINGIIIGAELAYAFTPTAFLEGFILNGLYVAIAEVIVCFGIGLIVYPKLKDLRIFTQTS